MAGISYFPKVQFAPFFDNVSRVRAQGPDGFNVRFDAIRAEFDALQKVIQDVNTAIDAANKAIADLSAKPAAQPRTATLTPNLTNFSADRNFQWDHGEGFASAPPGRLQAAGMMDVQLPNGVILNKLRIIGNKDTGEVNVELRRQQIAFGSAAQPITTITVPKSQIGTFDAFLQIGAARATVDNDLFRYYLVARVDNADPGVVHGVELDAILLTYLQ
jgi:hypothetical protein